jgi:hypothetical protein
LEGSFSAVSKPILQQNTHFAAFFEIFNIYRLLHSSTFKISRFFFKISQNSGELKKKSKILLKSFKFCNFALRFSPIFAGISYNFSKFDEIYIAIFKFSESFEKIPKVAETFCKNLSRGRFIVSPHQEMFRFTYGSHRFQVVRILLIRPYAISALSHLFQVVCSRLCAERGHPLPRPTEIIGKMPTESQDRYLSEFSIRVLGRFLCVDDRAINGFWRILRKSQYKYSYHTT